MSNKNTKITQVYKEANVCVFIRSLFVVVTVTYALPLTESQKSELANRGVGDWCACMFFKTKMSNIYWSTLRFKTPFFHRRFSERLYLIWRYSRCHIDRTCCPLEGVDGTYTAEWNTIYVERSLSDLMDRVSRVRVFATRHRLYDIDCRFGRVRNRLRY